MGKRSVGFVTSLLSVVNNNSYLKSAKPETVYMSAMMAATLDLPINPNLGFAYIIPYGDSAQFQMGYKGFIQLALRSGQFKTISSTKVYEGQIVEENPLTGYVFDWSKKTSDTVVGYAAYFSLINGFEKTFYMTSAQVNEHGKKFSKTYNNASGLWKKDFESMALKTVLKLLQWQDKQAGKAKERWVLKCPQHLEQLPVLKPHVGLLLSNVEFIEGKRYTDFDSTTDKVAAVGLSALIAGAAIKSGLLAKLWAFIIPLVIAGKKLLMLLVIALGGLAAKYFNKKPKPEQAGGDGGLSS